ncbi:FimV/HubP family polar landmark protein [Rhodanobacter hydrolyticus]|uniref:Fimbrial protein FimV n=1 Tax=Rhodanobacter hydrolyticus TaxID=2250595 RepID=A0ABW8JB78_9GAMM
MNRSLKLPLLVALALGSGQALAMDLGQIQVKSALGQPLLAEIPVQQASPAELQQLNVHLASGDASTGIPLHFAVVDGGDGHKVIRITSETAVNDPFLDLLVEVHGGNGKSVREFTILLDPPGSSPAPQPARVAHAAKPAAAPRQASSAAGTPSSGQAANGRWTVERGQTLSTVAHQTAPAGVDVNQMLLALKQTNPDAFYRDNINALKAGAVLRIPSKAEAEAIAIATAAEEVRRQNGDWRSGTVGSAPTNVADAGTRAGTSSSPTATGTTGDHLALVPAKQGSKSATDNSDALRQDLQRSKESLATLQQQGDDLKSRLKDLSDINSKNQRLLALKDNEIAELQQKLAAARKAAGAPAEPANAAPAATAPAATASKTATTPASIAPLPATPAGSATAAMQAAAPAAAATAPAASKPEQAAAPAKAEPVKATPAKPAASKPAPSDDEPWYSQLWAEVAGGVVVLLLVLWALLGRRKAKPASSLPKLAPSLADRFGSEPLHDADDVDQNLLLDQLAEHPDDIGLHLELVSLYYGRRDIDHFEAAAEAMHAHVSDPQQEEWQQVVRMGEDLVPGHPLFAHHDGASTEEHEAHHGFDIDRYAAEPVAAPAPAGPPPMPTSPVKVSEYNFNFDLTPPHESAAKHVDDTKPADEAKPVEQHAAADEDATVVRSSWQFDEPEAELQPAGHDIESRDFSDDPADTKLDLARAYLDMGDPEGARAMLEEVLHEGSQMQRDVAKRLLDDLH